MPLRYLATLARAVCVRKHRHLEQSMRTHLQNAVDALGEEAHARRALADHCQRILRLLAAL